MSSAKITILGDIMCEPRLLKAARTGRGNYDFTNVYQNVRSLLAESDYVIGNLETPLAGEAAGYVSSLFQFNAPDSFAIAAKEAGIKLLLTANNHCLDRGLEGLERTVRVLEENGIAHAGTFSEPGNRGNTYFEIGDTRIAVISYTYGTNYSNNHILLSEDERGYINLLRPQTESYFIYRRQKRALKDRIRYKIANSFHFDKEYYVRKLLGLPVNQAHEDDNLVPDTLEPYLHVLLEDIVEAKKNADFVLFCPHMGGQFNPVPGAFSNYLASFAVEQGVDAVVASHTHVVQKAVFLHGVPCFYSLGNFSMSPNSVYLLHENLPKYGIAAHLYLEDARIVKTSFSILRILEEDFLTVYPVDDYAKRCSPDEMKLLSMEVRQIFQTVTGNEIDGDLFRKEYIL